MLTDEQIKALLDKAKNDHNRLWVVSRQTTIELCTRVLTAERKVEMLEDALKNRSNRLLDMTARVKGLEDALLPFGKAGELFQEPYVYSDQLIYGPAAGPEYQITGDDLRRARKALETSLSPEHKLG